MRGLRWRSASRKAMPFSLLAKCETPTVKDALGGEHQPLVIVVRERDALPQIARSGRDNQGLGRERLEHISRRERATNRLHLVVDRSIGKERIEIHADRGEHGFDRAARKTVHEHATVIDLADGHAWMLV